MKQTEEMKKIKEIIDRIDAAQQALGGGREFVVGTKVLYGEKLGVITYLRKGSEDPAGSTVDLRLEDGTILEGVKVNAPNLQRYRS